MKYLFRLIAAAVLLALPVAAPPAQADILELMTRGLTLDDPDAIGRVTSVYMFGYGTPVGQERTAIYKHDFVYHDERIESVNKGGISLVFKDETVLTLGENAEIVLDEFAFDPNTTSGELGLKVAKGAFRFVSGDVPPIGVIIETPVANIGIRGTDFIADVIPASEQEDGTVQDPSLVVDVFSGEVVLMDATGAPIKTVAAGDRDGIGPAAPPAGPITARQPVQGVLTTGHHRVGSGFTLQPDDGDSEAEDTSSSSSHSSCY